MKTKNTKEKKKLTKEEKKHIRTKQISTNTIYLPLLFIAFALFFEFANFLHLGFLDSAGDKILFPTYFLFDLAVIVLIAAFLFLLKNKWVVYSFFIFFLLLQCALNVVNATMYNIFGDILSVDLLKLGGEAATAVTPEFIDWWGAILPLLIFGAMITAATFMMKYNKKTIEESNPKTRHISIMM